MCLVANKRIPKHFTNYEQFHETSENNALPFLIRAGCVSMYEGARYSNDCYHTYAINGTTYNSSILTIVRKLDDKLGIDISEIWDHYTKPVDHDGFDIFGDEGY
ncbi:MAG: hypothetical protein JKX76_02255 [Colwellia sp.]|nr:hypothetical protein [Colwellia sp.]